MVMSTTISGNSFFSDINYTKCAAKLRGGASHRSSYYLFNVILNPLKFFGSNCLGEIKKCLLL